MPTHLKKKVWTEPIHSKDRKRWLLPKWVQRFEGHKDEPMLNEYRAHCSRTTESPLSDIYDWTEISTNSESHTTKSAAVITFWESLTKCQTITFIKSSSDKLPSVSIIQSQSTTMFPMYNMQKRMNKSQYFILGSNRISNVLRNKESNRTNYYSFSR
jgi:hypothetical protein